MPVMTEYEVINDLGTRVLKLEKEIYALKEALKGTVRNSLAAQQEEGFRNPTRGSNGSAA